MDWLVDMLTQFSGPLAIYLSIFLILLACGFGLPIPEDVTLFAAGYIAYMGEANVWVTIFVCFAGVMFGDSAIFLLGRKYGRKLANRWLFRKVLSPERLDYVQSQLHRRGNKVVFMARFMPGMRAAIYFSAGTLKLPPRVFFTYDGLAAVLSVPAIVYSVFYFGAEVDSIIRVIKRVQFGIFGLIGAIILVFVAKWYLGRRKLGNAGKTA
ncbi:MAG: DedA family protein [Bdellovibrionales bacterium]|nr:DedA family protein [Bdellovibrionales bacterium]